MGRAAGLAVVVVIAGGVRGAQAQAPADPCVQCDVMYAGDCGNGLWRIDLATGTSALVGFMPQNLFDLAATLDGRLVGVTGGGQVMVVNACDATFTALNAPFVGNGLAGDLATTDLFAQGPPLVRFDSTGTGASLAIGGTIGPLPPQWCGGSAGDLAMSPVDGYLRTALNCTCAGGATRLQVVEPVIADVLWDAGCIQDAAGTPFTLVYGLAFDSTGTLWGTQGVGLPELLRIDPDTALAEVVPISGGYNCGYGLASVPCGVPPDPCQIPMPAPDDVGPALRVNMHGPANAADVTAVLGWGLDFGAPRPANVHFHVYRGTDPQVLALVPDPEPLFPTAWQDSTPRGLRSPTVHYYEVRAADDCERESGD